MGTPTIVCATAEIALNRYLRLEPLVLKQCAELAGRVMLFSLPSQSLRMAVEFIEGGVRVAPEAPQTPDVSLQGTPSAFIAALQVGGKQGALPKDLEVEGDLELLAQFQAMLQTVGFDLEEWLAPMLGGVTAHRLSDSIKKIFSWTQTNSRRMADHTAEYLREESYELARGRDVGHWMDEVDRLRAASDRIEARLQNLEARQRTAQEHT